MLTNWCRVAFVGVLALAFVCKSGFAEEPFPAQPIKVGVVVSASGPAARAGNQMLIALQLWRDDVNAQGGLLGRPIELVFKDDQSNLGKELLLYRKLLNTDKVDLILGPYGTVAAGAAMRAFLDYNNLVVSTLSGGSNRLFSNHKFFSMDPEGPDGPKGRAKDFFDFAILQQPKPLTAALVIADADLARAIGEGARTSAAGQGLKIIYDKTYPLETTDFGSVLGEVAAANPDVVFVSAHAHDAAAIVKAANAIGLAPKLFGGSMPGLWDTTAKAHLGPLLNGVVISDNFGPSSTLNFPSIASLFGRYRKKAAGVEADPLGYDILPFAYAAGQVLVQAIERTQGLNAEAIAEYVGNNRFDTVVGEVEFGKDGEWKQQRTLLAQFQHLIANNIDQFADGKSQPILWPPRYKTGYFIYPYVDAKK